MGGARARPTARSCRARRHGDAPAASSTCLAAPGARVRCSRRAACRRRPGRGAGTTTGRRARRRCPDRLRPSGGPGGTRAADLPSSHHRVNDGTSCRDTAPPQRQVSRTMARSGATAVTRARRGRAPRPRPRHRWHRPAPARAPGARSRRRSGQPSRHREHARTPSRPSSTTVDGVDRILGEPTVSADGTYGGSASTSANGSSAGPGLRARTHRTSACTSLATALRRAHAHAAGLSSTCTSGRPAQ